MWLYCEVIAPSSDLLWRIVLWRNCTVKWLYREVIVLWNDCTVKRLPAPLRDCVVLVPLASTAVFLPHLKASARTQCRILHKMPRSTCQLCFCLCRHGCSAWSDELLRVWLHFAVAGGRMPSDWPVCDRLCCPPYRLLIEVWQSFDWVVASCWNGVLGRRSDQVAGQSSTVLTAIAKTCDRDRPHGTTRLPLDFHEISRGCI